MSEPRKKKYVFLKHNANERMRRDKRRVKYIFEGEDEKETPLIPAQTQMSTNKSKTNNADAHLNIFLNETSGSNKIEKTNSIAQRNNANKDKDLN